MSAPPTHRWRRFLAHWVDFAARRAPWVVLAFLLLAAGAIAFTVNTIKIDTNREKMLSSDLPFRQAEARRNELFPQFADNLVLVVDGATPEDARDAALGLAARLRASASFREVYVPRADPFLESRGLLFLSTEELHDLSERLAKVQPFLGRLTGDESTRGLFRLLRQALDADDGSSGIDLTPVVRRVSDGIDAALRGAPYRLSWQTLMADEAPEPDERRQFVLAQPVLDYGTLLPATTALREVRAAAADLARDPAAGVRVRVTGGLAMAHEELQTVSRGAEWFALGVLLAVGLILWIGLRAGRLVSASLITLLAGLGLTAGFATLAIGHLNLISVAFGILYIGLGIDYAIHLCLRYREGIRAGRTHDDALRAAAQDVGGSLVLCSLSTALGFYAFVPTAYAGVSELGLISGTGMFISLVLNLTLLPALLTLLPLRDRPARAEAAGGSWRERFAAFPVRHDRPVLVASFALGVAGLALLPQVAFDFNPLNLRDRESESVATFEDLLRTSETPPWNLDVLAAGAAEAEATAAALEGVPEVARVVSGLSFVPGGQDGKVQVLEDTALVLGLDALDGGGEPPPAVAEQVEEARRLADAIDAWLAEKRGGTDRTAVQGLGQRLRRLAEAGATPEADALFARLGDGLLATLPGNMARLRTSLEAEAFTEADLPPSLRARWVAPDGTYRVQAFARDDLTDPAALTRFVSAVRAVAPDATGSPIVMLESGRAVAGAFRQALLVALAATALVLIVLLRNLRDVILVLVPLLLAGVLTTAAMILAGVPFNFANVIALPLLLGVGVDNGIHMVDRARHGMRDQAGANPLRTSTARAVVFSTLTTSCSFGQLALSPHPGTASMGLLLSLGMGFTLLCTLLVIPAMLARWGAPAAKTASAAS